MYACYRFCTLREDEWQIPIFFGIDELTGMESTH